MRYSITILTLAALLTAGSLSAQQTQPGQPNITAPQTVQSSAVDVPLTKDQVFAKCLAITNQEEVSIAKFAKEKSTNEEVKSLATTLEKSHQECLNELKALTSKLAVSGKAADPASPISNKSVHAVDFCRCIRRCRTSA